MTETEKLDFYRDAYEKAHKRAEALEKSRDQLFEREANHTEAYGMVCQERDCFKAMTEKWKVRAERAEAALANIPAKEGADRRNNGPSDWPSEREALREAAQEARDAIGKALGPVVVSLDRRSLAHAKAMLECALDGSPPPPTAEAPARGTT